MTKWAENCRPSFQIYSKFRYFSKISFFSPKFRYFSKISFFSPKFRFFSKISILLQIFDFVPKFHILTTNRVALYYFQPKMRGVFVTLLRAPELGTSNIKLIHVHSKRCRILWKEIKLTIEVVKRRRE